LRPPESSRDHVRPWYPFLRSVALRRVLSGRDASAVNGQAVSASA